MGGNGGIRVKYYSAEFVFAKYNKICLRVLSCAHKFIAPPHPKKKPREHAIIKVLEKSFSFMVAIVFC